MRLLPLDPRDGAGSEICIEKTIVQVAGSLDSRGFAVAHRAANQCPMGLAVFSEGGVKVAWTISLVDESCS
jgi:hypothetical protein